MTIFESAFERVSDEIESGKLKLCEYDLWIEILLKEGVETVHGERNYPLKTPRKQAVDDGYTRGWTNLRTW